MPSIDRAEDLPSADETGTYSLLGGTSSQSLKVAEAAQAMVATTGGIGSFTKVATNATSFANQGIKVDTSAIDNTLGGLGISSSDGGLKLKVPTAGSSTISAAEANSDVKSKTGPSRDHLVSLKSIIPGNGEIEFLVLPEIVENRTVEYEGVQPSQFPGAFQKYKGTAAIQWSINATFVSRTTAEATQNLIYLNRLRGWTMPYFGERTARGDFKNLLGAPPDVLIFKGLKESMIGPVPVVITSLNWNFPRDVDYIEAYPMMGSKSDEMVMFPSVMTVAIQLVESFSTTQFNQFDIKAFRSGLMVDAWTNPLPQITVSEGEKAPVNADLNPAVTDSYGVTRVAGAFSGSGTQDIRRLDGSRAGAGRGLMTAAEINGAREAYEKSKTVVQLTVNPVGVANIPVPNPTTKKEIEDLIMRGSD